MLPFRVNTVSFSKLEAVVFSISIVGVTNYAYEAPYA